MSARTFWLITALAIVMRLWAFWTAPLWYDENFTLILARLPFPRMMQAIIGDVHPPLFYIIEWLFMRIFPDVMTAPVWAIRVPSLIFSIASLFVFKAIMDRLSIPARVQVIAYVMISILPFQLWYAQEGRMYALLELEVLLALLFAMRRQFASLLLISAAMLYTQNYAPFYLAAVGMVILLLDLELRKWLKANVFGQRFGLWVFTHTFVTAAVLTSAFVLYLPWLSVIAAQMSSIEGRYWIFDVHPGAVIGMLYKLFFAHSMANELSVSGLGTVVVLVTLGIAYLLKQGHVSRWIILVMAFMPLLLAYIASLVWQPVLLHRPLIGTSPFLYVIAAWSVDHILASPQLRSRLLLACFTAPFLIAGVGGFYRNMPTQKNDGAVSPLSDARDYMLAHWQDGDIVYYTDDGPFINLLPYLGDLPQYKMPICGERTGLAPVLGSLTPLTRDAIGIQMANLADLQFKRAWVYAPTSPLHPECYNDQIEPLTQGEPLVIVDDNQYMFSALYLVEGE